MRYEYLSRDPNLMEIVVSQVDISPFVRHPAPLLVESGVIIKFHNYNLDAVLSAILDDYGIDKIIDSINNLRTSTEPLYVPQTNTDANNNSQLHKDL